MITYIALLRGINVSGQKKVPMAELREVLTNCGLKNVQTYIQSGNIIFNDESDDVLAIAQNLSNSIKNHFGFEVPVSIKTKPDLEAILEACPFAEQEKAHSYFTLLHEVPTEENMMQTKTVSYPNETFVVTPKCVYFYSATGYGKAKCNNNFFEKMLKVAATTRNYKTMVKLISMTA